MRAVGVRGRLGAALGLACTVATLTGCSGSGGMESTGGTPTTSVSSSTGETSTSPTPAGSGSASAAVKPVALLHDGAKPKGGVETRGENTAWTATTKPIGICWQGLPPAEGRLEQRSIAATVDTESWTETLVVFANADQAVHWMDLLGVTTGECSAGDGSSWKGFQHLLTGAWGEGLAISYGSLPNPNPSGKQTYLGETTVVAARVGRAVTIAARTSHGVLGTDVSEQGIADLRPALDHVAPQLCRYAESGC